MESLGLQIRQLLEETAEPEELEELDVDDVADWAMEEDDDDDCDDLGEGCKSHESDDDDNDDDDDAEEIDEEVRPGQYFVVVDISVPGGKMVGKTVYKGVAKADSVAEKMNKQGKNVQVIDAMWFNPARAILKAQGMIGEESDAEELGEAKGGRSQAYAGMDDTEKDMYDQLHMMASNEGRFYPDKPKEAVMFVFKEYVKGKNAEMRENFGIIQKHLISELQNDWQTAGRKRKSRG